MLIKSLLSICMFKMIGLKMSFKTIYVHMRLTEAHWLGREFHNDDAATANARSLSV